MKVIWRKDENNSIEGTICLKDKVFHLFDNNNIVIKLEKAEIEFINKHGFMVNGFLKYDSLNNKYNYVRYYFTIEGK